MLTKEKTNVAHIMLLNSLITYLHSLRSQYIFSLLSHRTFEHTNNVFHQLGNTEDLTKLSSILFCSSSLVGFFFPLNMKKQTLKFCQNPIPSRKLKSMSLCQRRKNFYFTSCVDLKFVTKVSTHFISCVDTSLHLCRDSVLILRTLGHY